MNLATLRLASDDGVVAARGKFKTLAETLGAREVEATQLAIVLSEVARTLLNERSELELSLDAEAMPLGTRLTLSLPGAREKHAVLLESVFGAVRRQPGKIQAEHRFPLALGEQEAGFLDTLRERLLERTRAELVSELKRQNESLEQHREQLEATVAERTRELERSTRRAEQASNAKGEFLSHMSHELRTPLNGVLGYAQLLLRDSAATERQKKSLNAIESCGRHLLTLINDVLDLSKIEAGKLELEPRPLDLHALLYDVSDIVRPRAAVKGVPLTLELDPNVPRGIVADETKLRQVLVNLLGNAAKFTDQGSIALSARLSPGGRLRLEVSDSGIGMTSQELSNLFQPFKQAEGGKVAGGTGLGLAITKKVVDAMGGHINVESTYGTGTRFRLELPLELCEFGDARTGAPLGSLGAAASLVVPEGRQISVLIVDDVEANRDILDTLLEAVGFECVHAVDGEDALCQMRERSFDLVLMDIRMPKLRGDEAIGIIRGDPRLKQSKVIAITASVQASVLGEMLTLGFDDVIGKPFELPKLLDKVGRLLELEVCAAPAPETVQTESAFAGVPPLMPEQATALSSAIREALDMGDIGELTTLGEALEAEGGSAASVGAKLRELGEAFDFEGLARLNAELLGQLEGAEP